MKRFTLSLVTLIVFVGCAKQATDRVVARKYYSSYGPEISQVDFETQGKTGEVVEVSTNGIEVRRSFIDGGLHGTSSWSFPYTQVIERFEEYDNGFLIAKGFHYENGTPRYEEQYGPNEIKIVRGWYDDGAPRLSEEYRNTCLLRGQYTNKNGDVEASVTDSKGTRIERLRDGTLSSREQIVGGFAIYREDFYSNGMLKVASEMKNGQKNGVAKVYLSSGQPLREEKWSKGVLNGDQIFYENGIKVALVPYSQGYKQGVEKRFRPGTDVVVQEITWYQDVRHGPTTTRIDSEEITDWYWRDSKVSKDQFQGRRENQKNSRASIRAG